MANKPVEFQHYPKWINGVVVENKDEEEAVLEERAIYEEVQRPDPNGGSEPIRTKRLVGIQPKKGLAEKILAKVKGK